MNAFTNDELAELEKRYTPDPVPPCRICGEALTCQATGIPVAWGCSMQEADPDKPGYLRYKPGRGGVREFDPGGHYHESRHLQYRIGDDDALRLLAAYRAQAAEVARLRAALREYAKTGNWLVTKPPRGRPGKWIWIGEGAAIDVADAALAAQEPAPQPALSELAARILAILRGHPKAAYMAEWYIADTLSMSRGEFSTRIPHTDADRALLELRDAGLIEELPDLAHRWRVTT